MVNDDHVAYCPAHEDPSTSRKPSAQINFERSIWFCFVCCPEAQDAKLRGLAEQLRERVETGEITLTSDETPAPRSSKPKPAKSNKRRPVPTPEQIASWRDALGESHQRMRWLTKERHLKQSTVDAWEIGYSNLLHRFTIPVYRDGELIDARCRSSDPDATTDKYLWWRGGEMPPLFGTHMVPEDAQYVVVFEGEFDAILAWQLGIPAVSGTAGAGTWKANWTPWFAGKQVYICYDEDKAGNKGRGRVTTALREVAEAVYWLNIGDFTDWVTAGGTKDKFFDAIDEARLRPVATAESVAQLPEHGEPVTLLESQNAMRDGKPIEFLGTVIGKRDPAFSVPRRVEFSCDQAKGAPCKNCSMNVLHDGRAVREYRPNGDLPRTAINATDEQVRKLLRTDIRARCADHLEVDIDQKWNVEDLVVTDSVEAKQSGDGYNDIVRTVYNVGTYNTPANSTVRIVGEQISSKKDQRGQLFSWKVDPIDSNIDSFRMTPELREQLKIYQVQPGERVADRLLAMAEDNAHHVTRIFGRPGLHLVFRLVYASPLYVDFLGKRLKSTLSAAIPGDSRTGKSDIGHGLVGHWRVGVVANCDNASQAGFIGGMIQIDNSWVPVLGLCSQYDRRAIIFDEAGSLAGTPILPAMSSIRSQGVAEIIKIRTVKAPARYREVMIFNPVNGSQLANLADGGMQAIRELFVHHEDIARFHLAYAVGRDEVPTHIINSRHADDAPEHVYTAELEHNLFLWAWSRTPDQIKFAPGVEDYILQLASRVGKRYSGDFPLLQTENAKDKFACGAAAVAQAVFSTKDGERVIVLKKHVDTWVRFLDEAYSSDLMGYRRMSIKHEREERASQGNVTEVREFLLGDLAQMSCDGKQVAKGLRSVGGRFETRSLADAASISNDEAMTGMRWLEDMHMVRRTRGGKYIEPLPALIKLLRQLEIEENNSDQ
jgi:hypothetical protein